MNCRRREVTRVWFGEDLITSEIVHIQAFAGRIITHSIKSWPHPSLSKITVVSNSKKLSSKKLHQPLSFYCLQASINSWNSWQNVFPVYLEGGPETDKKESFRKSLLFLVRNFTSSCVSWVQQRACVGVALFKLISVCLWAHVLIHSGCYKKYCILGGL